ncbi:hypothetical protein O3P69_018044 [Scylla paramamosain]|uniref:C2H2-type domain-containing protein n=1 Tax=Scylla paramamosain TaxID=85552 RepID=A0AAW0THB7_SCYPA
MLACPMCAKVFHGTKRKYRLDRHMLVHWGLKPFKCPHCPYRSTQQNNLNRHMKNVHWQTAGPAALLEVEAVLADEDDEMTSEEVAGGSGVYAGGSSASSCPVCGKIFEGTKRKYRLERHMTIHTGEKPFPCPLCVYRANQKEHLSRHIRNLHRLEPSEVPSSPQHAHAAAT